MPFIWIPYGTKYTATVAGYVWKYVTCSHCGCQYVYALKRQATGEGTAMLGINKSGAAGTARQSAYEQLDDALSNEIGIFCCPDCGMYQENMVEKLKREEMHTVTMGAVGIGIIVVLIVLVILSLASGSVGVIIACMVVCLYIWLVQRRFAKAKRLNPNANADRRRGQPCSQNYPVLRRAEYEQWQASKNKL